MLSKIHSQTAFRWFCPLGYRDCEIVGRGEVGRERDNLLETWELNKLLAQHHWQFFHAQKNMIHSRFNILKGPNYLILREETGGGG